MAWDESKKIVFLVDPDRVDGDLTNFPVAIHLNSAAGIDDDDLTAFFDELKLASYNDAFTGNNGDAPSSTLWNKTGSPDIQGNKLRCEASSGGSSTENVNSKFILTGDFDIQVDFSLVTYPATNAWIAALYVQSIYDTHKVKIDKRYADSTHKYLADYYTGSWTTIGSASSSDTSGKLRLVRSSGTITCYYWNGSSWTSLGTNATAVTTEPVYVYLQVNNDVGNPAAAADFDNFTINSGSVHYPEYRKKIAVYTSGGQTSGTQCYVDIESIDTGAETAVLHTKIPSVSGTNKTCFVLYYDNTQSDNTTYVSDSGDTAAQSVWDSNYGLVHHMANAPTGSGANKDSTGNNIDMSHTNMEFTDLVAGKCGNGLDLDGSNEYLSGSSATAIQAANKMTLEVVFKWDGSASYHPFYAKRDNSTVEVQMHIVTSSSKIVFHWNTGALKTYTSSFTISTGTWYYLVARFDLDAGTVQLYINDLSTYGGTGDTPSGTITTTTKNPYIGWDTWTAYFNGIIDEVRYSKGINRALEWCKATYYTLWDNLLHVNYQPVTPSAPTTSDVTADGVTLTGSTFSDPDSDTHYSSQWQIDLSGEDFSTPVYDSGEDTTNKTSKAVTGLSESTQYKARVRYRDNSTADNSWSEWSAASTAFTTLAANAPPATPTITVGTITTTTVSLSGSAFSDTDSGDTHHASQWQVDLSTGDFTSPVYDSGEDHSNLTSILVTSLDNGQTYKARVRYSDSSGKANRWSAWSSASSNFVTLNTKPLTPTCTTSVGPAKGQRVLSGSAFSDPDGDSHSKSQWQVDLTSEDFSTPEYDSGESNDLTSHTATGLSTATAYKARVRYKDNSPGTENRWSEWSSASAVFYAGVKPATPVISRVSDWSGTSLILWSSAFSSSDGSSHSASQWQVDFITADFSTPFYDSGENSGALVSCPVYSLLPDWAYRFRVKHKDNSGDSTTEWSDWSEPFLFNDSEWRSRMGATLSTLRKYVRREIGDPAPERKLSSLSLVHDGGNNTTTFFQDASHNFVTLGVEVGDVIYNVTDGGSISIVRAIGSGSGTNDKLYVESIDGGTDNDFDNSDVIYIYDRYARKHLDGTRFSDTEVDDAINQSQKLVAIRFGGVEKTRVHEDIALHSKVELVSVSGTFQVEETVTGGTNGHTAVVEYASTTMLVLSQFKTRIDYDGSAGTFLVGEQVSFGTSGATGRVESLGSGYMMVSDLDDDPVNDETITGGTSGATASVNEATAFSPGLFAENETITGGTSSATAKIRDSYTAGNLNVGQGVPTDLKSLKVAKYWDGTQWCDLPIFHIMEVIKRGKATGDPLTITQWQERLWLWPNETSRRVDALHLWYLAWGTDLDDDTDEIDFGPQFERIVVLEAAKVLAGIIEDNKRWTRITEEIEKLNYDIMACDIGEPNRVNQEHEWGSTEDSYL